MLLYNPKQLGKSLLSRHWERLKINIFSKIFREKHIGQDFLYLKRICFIAMEVWYQFKSTECLVGPKLIVKYFDAKDSD